MARKLTQLQSSQWMESGRKTGREAGRGRERWMEKQRETLESEEAQSILVCGVRPGVGINSINYTRAN